MKKYLQIAKNTLGEYFIYRVNFIFWRLQTLISFVTFFYLWSAISSGKSSLGVYNIPQIYSYFVIGYLIRALVFSTRTADIGGDIQSGQLSSLLLKPISPIKYYLSRDIIDKIFNLSFLSVELFLVFMFFRPDVVYPTIQNLTYFTVSVFFAIVIFFFYSLSVSFITFWSDHAWSSRFLFGVVFINLFSGQYLPLDFLPKNILSILNFTPLSLPVLLSR